MNLHLASSILGSRSYAIPLHVKLSGRCAEMLEDNYMGEDECLSSPLFMSAYQINGAPDLIEVFNIRGLEFATSVQLDCNTGNLIIPFQTHNNFYTISGNGTFKGKIITLHYTITAPGFTDTCTVVMTRNN